MSDTQQLYYALDNNRHSDHNGAKKKTLPDDYGDDVGDDAADVEGEGVEDESDDGEDEADDGDGLGALLQAGAAEAAGLDADVHVDVGDDDDCMEARLPPPIQLPAGANVVRLLPLSVSLPLHLLLFSSPALSLSLAFTPPSD